MHILGWLPEDVPHLRKAHLLLQTSLFISTFPGLAYQDGTE